MEPLVRQLLTTRFHFVNFMKLKKIFICFSLIYLSSSKQLLLLAKSFYNSFDLKWFDKLQAKFNNIADVAAKDGSQETLVNITALFCNMIILPLVSGKSLLVWLLYFLFTIVHLFANYRAVTALQFRTLNQRLLSLIARLATFFHLEA